MIDLQNLTLRKGHHDFRESGVCLLEAVAWFAGETHSDHPQCVSPILGSFGRNLNDVLPDDKRQQLSKYIPLMPGTAGDGLDEQRGYLALDWLIRTYTPAWLSVAGLHADASLLRMHAPVIDMPTARSISIIVHEAKNHAAAAWTAAGDAAWDAAWTAVGYAARAAAWTAVGAAAGAAAGATAWDAAGAAARAAAWTATGDKLTPTVSQLQNSAIELLGAMIAPEGK